MPHNNSSLARLHVVVTEQGVNMPRNKLVQDELERIARKWYDLRQAFGIDGNEYNDFGIAQDLFHQDKRRDEQIERWFHGLYFSQVRSYRNGS